MPVQPRVFCGVRRLLIDLSGTLHVEDQAIGGAVQALTAAVEAGLRVDFVSNTSKEGRADLLARLHRVGLGQFVTHDNLHTSLSVTACAVRNRRLRPVLLLSESAKSDFPAEEGATDSVVVGLAPERFNYADLNRAFGVVSTGGQLLAAHKGRYLRKADGNLHLGPGPFVAALEFAASASAEVFGKPSAAFFESVLGADWTDPGAAVMIGDDAKDDVIGAMRWGLKAILVQTGKYTPDDEKSDPAPTAVCSDILAAVQRVLQDL